MRTIYWTMALAGALAVWPGCALERAEQATDRRVAQLPVGERQRVTEQEQRADAAWSGVKNAEVAVDQARTFRDVTRDERRAAASQLHAADRSVKRHPDLPYGHAQAEREQQSARLRLDAAQAKEGYADRVLDFRQAQLDEQQATLALRRAELREAKLRALEEHGLAGGIDRAPIERSRSDAQTELARAQQRSADRQGQVAQAREAWQSSASLSARAGTFALPPAPAPEGAVPPPDNAAPAPRPTGPAPMDAPEQQLPPEDREGAGTTP